MALNIKIAAFWDMMLYSLEDKCQYFVGICILNLQGRRSKEDGSSRCLSDYIVTSQEMMILIICSLLSLHKFYYAKVNLVQ